MPKAVCDKLISACDKALEDKKKEIELKDLALKQSQDASKKLADDLVKEREEKDSFWRNPVVLIIFGAILGITIEKYK